jgi:hypothetical protein
MYLGGIIRAIPNVHVSRIPKPTHKVGVDPRGRTGVQERPYRFFADVAASRVVVGPRLEMVGSAVVSGFARRVVVGRNASVCCAPLARASRADKTRIAQLFVNPYLLLTNPPGEQCLPQA